MITKPTFEILQPSQNKTLIFRPYLVREEKILLVAQSGNDKDVIRAITQILSNCSVNDDLNIDTLTTFDLEYMFLKLRSKSVNNIISLEYRDLEDEKIYKFEIDLDELEMVEDEGHSKKIEIGENTGIIMKYPYISITENAPDVDDPVVLMDYLITNCIDSIYDNDSTYKVADYTPEEIHEFVDDLDINSYEKIKNFFDTMPKMYKLLEYTNEKGTTRKIELKNLTDFFTWG